MPRISFRVTDREAAHIRELAGHEGLAVSEFVRRRAMGAVTAPDSDGYRVVEDPLTGLPVMEGPAGMAPVSSEQVRALMVGLP